jgi:hypothetical protein
MAKRCGSVVNAPCIKCGERDLQLHLADLDGDCWHCCSCEEDFSTDAVREHLADMASWPDVLAWVEAAPCVAVA